jgi:acetyl-CoA synthetase
MYAASIEDPEAFWGEHGKRIDWIKPYTKVKNTDFDLRQGLDPLVRGRHAERLGQLHRPPSGHARRPDRDHLGADDPKTPARHITYAGTARADVCRMANVLKAHGRRQGRPGGALPADDPRGGLCDAGLRADRRGPFGRLRRLLARCAGQPDQRQRAKAVITADEAPRGGRKTPLKANTDKALLDVRTG